MNWKPISQWEDYHGDKCVLFADADMKVMPYRRWNGGGIPKYPAWATQFFIVDDPNKDYIKSQDIIKQESIQETVKKLIAGFSVDCCVHDRFDGMQRKNHYLLYLTTDKEWVLKSVNKEVNAQFKVFGHGLPIFNDSGYDIMPLLRKELARRLIKKNNKEIKQIKALNKELLKFAGF